MLNAMAESTHRARISLRLVAVVTLVSGFVHLPGLVVGPSLDAAVFDVVGWRVAHGLPLYAGIWDHKPPATYAVSIGAELMGRWVDPWLVIWVVSVVATTLVALLVARLLLRAGLESAAPLAAVAVAILAGEYLLALGGGLSEPVALVAALLAFVLAAEDGSVRRWSIAGGLLTLGVLVSVQVAPAGMALVAAWWWSLHRRRSAAGLVVGGLVVLAATIGLLAGLGLLPDVVDAVITYNGAYRAVAAGSSLTLRALPWTVLALVPLLALAAAGMLAARRVHGSGSMAVTALAWLVAGVVLIVVQGRFYAHYAIPLVVPLALLAGIGWEDLRRLVDLRRFLRRPLMVMGIALVLLAVGAGAAGGLQELRTWDAANGRSRTVAQAVRDLSAPGDTLLVWGNEPYLYRLADRAPAIRYPYLLPLTTPGYVDAALVEELVSELRVRPPTVVVDAGSPGPGEPGIVPLLMDRPVSSEGRDADLLDPLREFVRSRYELDAVVDGWPVYRLRDG